METVFQQPLSSLGDAVGSVIPGLNTQQAVSNVLEGANNLTRSNIGDEMRQAGANLADKFGDIYTNPQGGVGRGNAGVTRADVADLAGGVSETMEQMGGLADMITQGGVAMAALKNQSIDNSAVAAGLSEIGGLIEGIGGGGLGAAMRKPLKDVFQSGITDIQMSDLVDNLTRMGKPPDIINAIMKTLDLNRDGEISVDELEKGARDTVMMDKLTSIDANTAKMIKDPDYRRRVIQKENVPSIYGNDFDSRFNQVTLVEQGLAGSNLAANQFNVSY